ncbi:MAG: glutaredoxin [bacterium]
MEMKNVVYTIGGCAYCDAVKRLLGDHEIAFEERRIEAQADMLRLKEQYGWRTFPMVILNGEFIGGYDQTRALADKGKLEAVLRRRTGGARHG